MANLSAGLFLTGTSSSITMGTTPIATPTLAAGVYAFWCPTQNGYISPAPSTALSATNGYPIIGGAAPIQVTVGAGQQIGAVSSSSGLLVWQKLG